MLGQYQSLPNQKNINYVSFSGRLSSYSKLQNVLKGIVISYVFFKCINGFDIMYSIGQKCMQRIFTCSNVPFEPVIHADSPDPCPGSADRGERLEIVEENGQ